MQSFCRKNTKNHGAAENAFASATVKRLHPLLPIFRIDSPLRCVLYTPSHLAVVASSEADAIFEAWNSKAYRESKAMPKAVAHWLKQKAQAAVAQRAAFIESPFAPECLTIYLSSRCNLNCSYCYAAHSRSQLRAAGRVGLPVLDPRWVEQAACQVAKNCLRKKKPFWLVIHGGGEPTLNWERLQEIVAITRHTARQLDLSWSGGIATNGVLPEQQARWLARHFNAIGLSCDGPPDIQDRQRPLVNGKGSSLWVQRSAGTMAGQGARITARATITPDTMCRQVEIVDYLCRVIGADEIRFEPAYFLELRGLAAFKPQDAPIFIQHFLEARRRAGRLGHSLSFSGVRPKELHGPFCQTLRQVLQLTPDGSIGACFLCTDGRQTLNQRAVIGRWMPEYDRFVLDHARIETLNRQINRISDRCRDCFNHMHCSRGCPDVCAADIRPNSQESFSAEFRCQVNRGLALALILESAEEILAARKRMAQPVAADRRARVKKIENCLSHAPSAMDGKTILAQFRALGGALKVEDRKMPVPLWKRHGLEEKGAVAFRHLQEDIGKNAEIGPISIYLHIPFCEQHCGFCDCLSIFLKRRQQEAALAYGRLLIAEMDAWAGILPLSRRPVTTVHFGGGSPQSLCPDLFDKIVTHCRNRFHTHAATEWAVETTAHLLSDEHLGTLAKLGFARLHVGVQTLSDPLRQTIGRRHEGRFVLKRLQRAMNGGFITSVDLIYGLPGQTLKELATDLIQLIDHGIHGISLYRLNRSSRNRSFLKRFDGWKPDALNDYIFLQAADQLLARSGFFKNHYTHYARGPNGNLYANHLCRGEDLLALGATADGIFADYLYRHVSYAAYVKTATHALPALAGGLRETARQRRIRTLTAMLMSGKIHTPAYQMNGVAGLIGTWQDHGLVIPGKRKEELDLTANGAWFIYQMIEEIEQRMTGR
jgi:coproporphyrinogen III oxidase-like Fe-S oxidoreductase/sulfatase maturation enzyme AslB (radical SAM superfamily)